MDDLKYIKKYYGEKMMQLCRELFPTILEEPGKLLKLMEESFAHSKYLYYDIVDNALNNQFKNYIYQKSEGSTPEISHTTKTPQELMREVGYELYECTTEEQIQSFKKYYKPGEELCTFKGDRLSSCYVFFAVREDAEKLDRCSFKKPRREDDYGISVISIQFSRNNYTLSIKNRYNQKVYNPDATYGNDLENIIPGLTDSFEKKYGFKINQNTGGNFEIPNYTKVNGKFYKFNYEINNIYYCPNNIIIHNGIIYQAPQEQYILMDYFMLDIKNKKIFLIDQNIEDGFINEYKNIETIEIKKEGAKKRIIITTKEGNKSIITVNQQNQIIEYENNKIKKMNSKYMHESRTIEHLSLQNLEEMSCECFTNCESLETLYLPEIISMDHKCFYECNNLKKFDAPKLKTMSQDCFSNAISLEEINLPEIIIMGKHCFRECDSLKKLDVPKLKTMSHNCFSGASSLEEINLPEIIEMDKNCFAYCGNLKILELPKIKIIEEYCFFESQSLEQLFLPKVETIGDNCFFNAQVKTVYAPNLKECHNCSINDTKCRCK